MLRDRSSSSIAHRRKNTTRGRVKRSFGRSTATNASSPSTSFSTTAGTTTTGTATTAAGTTTGSRVSRRGPLRAERSGRRSGRGRSGAGGAGDAAGAGGPRPSGPRYYEVVDGQDVDYTPVSFLRPSRGLAGGPAGDRGLSGGVGHGALAGSRMGSGSIRGMGSMSTFASVGDFVRDDTSAVTQLQFGMDTAMLDSQSSLGTGASSASSLSGDGSERRSVADSSLVSGGTVGVGVGGGTGGIIGVGTAEVEVIKSRHAAAAAVPVYELSREELDAEHTITLSETETFVMLDFAARVVEADSEEAAAVLERNARYQALKEARIGSDAYAARGVQTYNRDLKSKEVQWTPAAKKTAGTQASAWSIHDETHVSTADDNDDAFDRVDGGALRSRAVGTDAAMDVLEAAWEEAEALEGGVGPDAGPAAGIDSSMDASTSSLTVSDSMSSFAGSQSMSTVIGDGSVLNTTAGSLNQTLNTSLGGRGGTSLAGLAGVAAMSMEQRARAFLAKPDRVASLADTLRVVERVVSQNVFHWRQLAFRGMDPAGLVEPDADDDSDLADDDAEHDSDDELFGDFDDPAAVPRPSLVKPPSALAAAESGPDAAADPAGSLIDQSPTEPSLSLLWRFECDATRGRSVTCMGWNPRDQDLLAVGYGAFHAHSGPGDALTSGLVLCWSLKNVFAPERVIHLPSGVTSVDTSRRFPNLLAIGMFSGAIAVYDLQTQCTSPIFETGHIREKHRDPVWQLQWVDLGMEKGERLVSVSTDGFVKEWSIKKGLEFQSNLMTLARVTNPAKTSAGDSEVSVWRNVGGLSMAFSPVDPTMYLLGTESGNIHRCSSSYNEQYLASHSAHVGPVYAIHWSPFVPDIFISTSTDWSVKVWDVRAATPLIDVRTCSDATNDVAWSALDATVFATANNDGTLQIWDMSLKDYLDPIISHTLGPAPAALTQPAGLMPASAADLNRSLIPGQDTAPAAGANGPSTGAGPSATGTTGTAGAASGPDDPSDPRTAAAAASSSSAKALKIPTAVIFARNDNVVLCGNSVGQVEVFAIRDIDNAIRVDDPGRSLFDTMTSSSADLIAHLAGTDPTDPSADPTDATLDRTALQASRLRTAIEANGRPVALSNDHGVLAQ